MCTFFAHGTAAQAYLASPLLGADRGGIKEAMEEALSAGASASAAQPGVGPAAAAPVAPVFATRGAGTAVAGGKPSARWWELRMGRAVMPVLLARPPAAPLLSELVWMCGRVPGEALLQGVDALLADRAAALGGRALPQLMAGARTRCNGECGGTPSVDAPRAADPFAVEAAVCAVVLVGLTKSSKARQAEFAAEMVRQLAQIAEALRRRTPPLPLHAAPTPHAHPERDGDGMHAKEQQQQQQLSSRRATSLEQLPGREAGADGEAGPHRVASPDGVAGPDREGRAAAGREAGRRTDGEHVPSSSRGAAVGCVEHLGGGAAAAAAAAAPASAKRSPSPMDLEDDGGGGGSGADGLQSVPSAGGDNARASAGGAEPPAASRRRTFGAFGSRVRRIGGGGGGAAGSGAAGAPAHSAAADALGGSGGGAR